MTIIADLIFMAVDAWFNEYLVDDTDNTVSFPLEEDVDEFLDKVNANLNDLRKFDNFKGGFCVTDDNRTIITIILYVLEDEEMCVCTKNFEITY